MEPHSEGLLKFYSSQAELLLAQYENINQLLGPTTDWTHPGTHCEVLLRDFLRRHLLKWMSVDKGYIFGRVGPVGQERHGPEIDILIHDTLHFRPVFRLDDFVIVQPESVLGMIQVKRTFRSGKEDSLASGLGQAVRAKQHLLDVLVQKKAEQGIRTSTGSPDLADLLKWKVFSAVVSFEDESEMSAETYRKRIVEVYKDNWSFAYPACKEDTGVYVLPDFVGSIKHRVLYSDFQGINLGELTHRTYYSFQSWQGEVNVGLQLFLASLTKIIFDWREAGPPFAFPSGLAVEREIQLPNADESLHRKPKLGTPD